MKTDLPVAGRKVYLRDYTVPNFRVLATELTVELLADCAEVGARLTFARHPEAPADAPLVLSGAGLELLALAWNGQALADGEWHWADEQWVFPGAGDEGVLETRVRIRPDANLALEGLYRSHGLYCTQCEAEGFRKITLYPDRPDVLAPFRVTVVGDKASCPVLLANGNCVARGDLEGGRHFATWEDPHPKPSYLFALVAGDLACLEDRFVTASGREVVLQIFTAPEDQDKCRHAMDSLKASMRWDEEKYGCEYDLDIYMIVAVSHFNMGAMENKGLNVFNTSCVLAHPATTTDAGFQRVESVVAHEYFHNWSGNRVTCRDWFQLCLKEGFTVFRDQQFSADQLSAAVQRLEDVAFLRTHQFAEDAGPLAHPVRPESFVEINNFYTLTVYEKGAEIARMLHTVLGAEGFRRGTDRYFADNDGRAATVEDFLDALGAANGRDLADWTPRWLRWFRQPGTPTVRAQVDWRADRRELVLTLSQSQPALAGHPQPEPLPVPVRVGLVGAEGELTARLAARPEGTQEGAPDGTVNEATGRDFLLLLSEREQQWTFSEVAVAAGDVPVLSLFRDFSAPVNIDYACDDADLARLVRHDGNGFNRWAAAQTLATREILARYAALATGAGEGGPAAAADPAPGVLADALAGIWPALADSDPALAVKLLELPSPGYLAEQVDVYDPPRLHAAREAVLATVLQPLLARLRVILARGDMLRPYHYAADDIAARALARTALDGLALLAPDEAAGIAAGWLAAAPHMTAEQSALTLLVHHRLAGADAALQRFHQRWRHEALVLDQWFATQASRPAADAVEAAQALLAHPDFDATVPNRVRAVLTQLGMNNPVAFHRADGSGYALLAAQIREIDARNPQLASRLSGVFGIWRKLDAARQTLVRGHLDALLAGTLSPDVRETLSRIRGEG